MEILKVGTGFYVPNAKNEHKVIDVTRNRGTLSIIILKTNNKVILSPIALTTLLKNVNNSKT